MAPGASPASAPPVAVNAFATNAAAAVRQDAMVLEETGFEQLRRRTHKTEAQLKTALGVASSRTIKHKVPWLLPHEDSTLLQLVSTLDPVWIELVEWLVWWHERDVKAEEPTFRIEQPQKELKQRVAQISAKAPPLELLLYDPAMSAQTRDAAWRAQIGNITDPRHFVGGTDVRNMEWADIHPDQQNELFEQFLQKLHDEPSVLAQVMQAAKAQQRVAQLDELEAVFYPTELPRLGAPRQNITIPDVAWNVEACVDKVRAMGLGMGAAEEAKLKTTLGVWQRNGLFKNASQTMLEKALSEAGANGTETMLIIQELRLHNAVSF